MSEYREAELVVNPTDDVGADDLAVYVRRGGRVVYFGRTPPPGLFPAGTPDGHEPKGVRGVAWCAPGLGPLSEMPWQGHAGEPPLPGGPAAGTHVLALMNDGSPFLAFRALGQGGILILGRSEKVFMRDDLLLEAVRLFLRLPLGPRLRMRVSPEGPSAFRVRLEGADPLGRAAKAEVEIFPLLHDPLLEKEIALELPSRRWKRERPVSGAWSWVIAAELAGWPAGRYVLAAAVRDGAGEFLAATATLLSLASSDGLTVRCARGVAIQGQAMRVSIGSSNSCEFRWLVLAPNGRLSASGRGEVAAGRDEAIEVAIGDWLPGRYLFRAIAERASVPAECLFHVAPRRFDVPHWTGLWSIPVDRERPGLLFANWRAAGLTYLSWKRLGTDLLNALGPARQEGVHRLGRIRACFDRAAAAGVKINLWGHNDKSGVPRDVLENWGIPFREDMVFEPPPGQEKGWGKCLTHPKVIAALRNAYEQIGRSGILAHPAFGFFTLGDEPGKYVRCRCARCARRYRESMAARGLEASDLGGRTWEEAFDIATRQSKPFRANKLYFTELHRDWYAAMAEALRGSVPDLGITVNHGGSAFTLARDQYPFLYDEIFSILEADVYPWYTCDDVSCVIDRTGYTTAMLRSVAGLRKPVAVIVNLSMSRGKEGGRIQPLRRPPQITAEDHYEQMNVAIAEGAQRIEGYNGSCYAGLPALGKQEFLKERPEVMGLADGRFIREVLVPTAAVQEVQRETGALLDLFRPLIERPNRPAAVALFQPVIHEGWGGRWLGHFKRVMGGAPVDFIGEDLELLDRREVIVLGENASEANVPPRAMERLRAWVERGHLLVSARANIGGLFREGGPRELGRGRTYLLGADVKEDLGGVRRLGDILVREGRLPIAWTDDPFSTVGIKDLGETLYLFVLYYRSSTHWSREKGSFGLYDGRPAPHPPEKDIAVTLNLPGPFAIYDCLEGRRLPGESGEGRTTFRARFALSRLKVFAALRRPVAHLAVACEEVVRAGSPIRCSIRSGACHLVQVRVVDPRGECHPLRTGSFLTRRPLSFPSYENDLPGRWTIHARDPGSGATAETAFTLREPSR